MIAQQGEALADHIAANTFLQLVPRPYDIAAHTVSRISC
jgi:hypothetical protein